MKVFIYSNEHRAWWRPNYCGYTSDKSKAGIFDYNEAIKKYPYINFDTIEEDYFVKLKIQPDEDPKVKETIKEIGRLISSIVCDADESEETMALRTVCNVLDSLQ